MCGNRVEELETRVQELEASVEGLTDELVECKVRIRELENTVDAQNGFSSEEESAPSAQEPSENAGADTEEAKASSSGDIIVPEVGSSNTEGPEGTDNTTADSEADAESDAESEEDSGSDIIVA